jgi:hypothetical protein
LRKVVNPSYVPFWIQSAPLFVLYLLRFKPTFPKSLILRTCQASVDWDSIKSTKIQATVWTSEYCARDAQAINDETARGTESEFAIGTDE